MTENEKYKQEIIYFKVKMSEDAKEILQKKKEL